MKICQEKLKRIRAEFNRPYAQIDALPSRGQIAVNYYLKNDKLLESNPHEVCSIPYIPRIRI